MDYQLNTRLNGNIAMTSSYHERASLQRDKTLYKFIWVQSGTLTLEIDHIPMRLEKDEIVTLTPLLLVDQDRINLFADATLDHPHCSCNHPIL